MVPIRFSVVFAFFCSAALAQTPRVGGCPAFPGNNIWNTPVDTLPVDPQSPAYVNSITSTGGLRWDAVIPINIVPGTQPPVRLNIDALDESDPGPYPIPANAAVEDGSDQHVIVVDKDNCILYETFASVLQPDGSWSVGSAAKWNLNSNALRPASWTSADAAGLPIMSGLVRYEEVLAGEINHAVRFTAPRTQRLFVWPARHYASHDSSASLPPMGQRFRLKAGFDISPYSSKMQVILRALKKYGMMLADNGLPWEIQYAADPRWNEDELNTLRSVAGSNFEALDVSSLIFNADSGQAGTNCLSMDPSLVLDASAQTVAVPVLSGAGCVWSISGGADWLTSPTAPMSGAGMVTLTVTGNNTGTERTGTLTVGGQTLTVTQRRTTTQFRDVPPTNPFFDAINLMLSASITSGCSAASYCPDDNVTRGQMAVVIVRMMMGSDSFPYNSAQRFDDVPPSHAFFKWIQKLAELGITTGCSANSFCPNQPISRGQMAVFIVRARYGAATAFPFSSTPYFSDVPAAHPYFAWIQKIRQVGITSGCTTSTYCADNPITRGQMAVFIMRGGFNQLLSPGTPIVRSVSPAVASPGQTVNVNIAAVNTNFGTSTQVTAGPGIAVSSVIVISPTTLIAQFNVGIAAALGPRSIEVITGTEEATLPNGFQIQ